MHSFFLSPRFLARLALAFCFLSFGLWEIVDPASWESYVPFFVVQTLGNVELLVRLHGIALTIVALCVLFGVYLRVFTIIAALMIGEIVAALWLEGGGFTETFIRDVTILLFILAMVADAWRGERA